MFNGFKRFTKEESGQAIVLFALAIVVLLGFAALTVDLGYAYAQKSRLQNAADAAALAGAMSIPTDSDAAVKGKVVEYVNKIVTDTEINSTINRTESTVSVQLTQAVPKFFSRIITNKNYSVAVKAKARSNVWDGEALPFLNLDDTCEVDGNIELWEKTAPGDFERIWKDDYECFYPDQPNRTYFTIDYQDGISVTKGKDAEIKKPVENIFNQHKPVYLFSLSNEVIDQDKYDNLDNKDVIPLNDLILLKVIITDYEEEKILKAKIVEIYDIVNGDLPWVDPNHDVIAYLIPND